MTEIAAASAPRTRKRRPGAAWDVLGVVALGGAIGSLLRYGASVMWPTVTFPWATLLVNIIGCFAIGGLMFVIIEIGAHRLARPFLGVGVLGGFTTFSTYVTDAARLVLAGHIVLAALYLAGTIFAALVAVMAGLLGARALARYKR